MDNQIRGKVIKWVTIILLIAAAIVAVIIVVSSHRKNVLNEKYDQAVELTMKGNWKGSIETFEYLAKIDFKGSKDFYLYCKGKQQYEEGDLKAAYKTLGQAKLNGLTSEQREL